MLFKEANLEKCCLNGRSNEVGDTGPRGCKTIVIYPRRETKRITKLDTCFFHPFSGLLLLPDRALFTVHSCSQPNRSISLDNGCWNRWRRLAGRPRYRKRVTGAYYVNRRRVATAGLNATPRPGPGRRNCLQHNGGCRWRAGQKGALQPSTLTLGPVPSFLFSFPLAKFSAGEMLQKGQNASVRLLVTLILRPALSCLNQASVWLGTD